MRARARSARASCGRGRSAPPRARGSPPRPAAGSSLTPRSLASRIRSSSTRGRPAPRAMRKRRGARSGNTSDSCNSTARGSQRRAKRSTDAATAAETMITADHHTDDPRRRRRGDRHRDRHHRDCRCEGRYEHRGGSDREAQQRSCAPAIRLGERAVFTHETTSVASARSRRHRPIGHGDLPHWPPYGLPRSEVMSPQRVRAAGLRDATVRQLEESG